MNWHLRVGGDELVFGHHDEDIALISAPEVSYGDLRGEEYTTDGVDGRTFGVDNTTGLNILFDLALRRDTEAEVRATLDQLRRLWRGDAARSQAGGVAELVSPFGRVTFGRTRRFAARTEWMADGRVDATVDFAATTDLWFSPESFSTSVRIVPPPSGGFVAPFVFPLTSSGSANESASFEVGGEVPAWPVFEIAGPIQRPAVEVVGLFRLEYGGSLAYDEVLTIDTNPHVRSVTVNGAGVSLTPSSDRLLAAKVPPGVHVLSLFGTSSSGTATATVRWRDSYTTY